MSDKPIDEEAIFKVVCQIGSSDARAEYLNQVCGGNPVVLERVETLLRVYDQESRFLESPPPGLGATIDQPITEKPGTVIGPYKLLQQIGEGGMGVVYMAEQKEPVKRRVALKIIKPGMDTRQVIARFEAERQALAMMDHPNIAKVLDAGATDSGRPYFVMELVNGISVTQYCDEQHLTPKERLELFIPICQAVQHAHQKGIIHRDLKPSNVMIALYDDRAVPKVIDFGVAKATSQTLTEKTMFTQLGQIVGTLEYMSPEQAQRNQMDIDTRSDIYSLGVLLYELLTGDTPFDRERLRSAAFEDMLRIIREEEPSKPSIKISTSARAPSIAANRSIDAEKLGTLIRGELDWIVMKALEKDRGRRYATANNFAEDIQRYLNDEAVVACPPSAQYRFRKFARRNRSALVTASIAATALLTLTIVAALAAARFRDLAQYNADLVVQKGAALNAETDAKNNARQAQNDAEDALEDARHQRGRAEDNLVRARAAVDEFLNQVTDNELLSVPGLQPLRRDLLISALEFYQEFAAEKADDPALQVELAGASFRVGRIQRELGQTEAGDASITAAVKRYTVLRDQDVNTIEVQTGLARALYYLRRYDETLELCRSIRETDADDPEIINLLSETYNALALKDGTDQTTALGYHRQALPLRQELVDRFPGNAAYLASLGATLNNLGVLLSKQSQRREAQDMYRQATLYKARAYELAPHSILWGNWLTTGLRNEASMHRQRGLHEQALHGYRQVVDVKRKLVFDNPAVESLNGDLAKAWLDLGTYQRLLKKSADANRSLRRVVEILEQMPRETPAQLFSLAAAYASLAIPPDEDLAAEPEEERVEGPKEVDEFAAEQRTRYARLAIETLDQAIDKGFADLEAFESSQPLQALAQVEQHKPSLERAREALRSATALSKDEGQKTEIQVSRDPHLPLFRELIDTHPPEVRRQITLASAAHSVGVLLTRLEEFAEAEQSLRTACEIRQDLLSRDPRSPQFQAESGGAHIAMAGLLWETDRLPEAFKEFDVGLDLLQAAATVAPDDPLIRQQVADWERRAYIGYGKLGLWDEATEYARRNLAFERVTNVTWDSRFSMLLGLTGDVDGQRRYAQLIADRHPREVPLILLASCTIPDPAMTEAELLSWAESVNVARDDWRATMAGIAYYRGREYEKARKLIEGTSSNIQDCYREYWLAMIYAKLDNQDEAAQTLHEAEGNYVDLGKLCVTESSVADEFGEIWDHLVQTQLIRSEAWQELKGRMPPPDPWQHLIRARGYWLIGKKEQAEIELAAAIDAAPNDPDVRCARAKLFARLGLDERVAGEWQKAFELAGDDPRPWMQRGRWHTRRGEDELALADFRGAAKLAGEQQLWEVRAEALDRLGQWDEAIEDLCRVIPTREGDNELLVRRATLYGKTQQPHKAVKDFCKASGLLRPFIMESGWQLTRSVVVPGAQAARFSPIEGRLYVGKRDTNADGLYRIDDDHSIQQIAEGDRVSGVVVDREDETILFSEGRSGLIYRVANGTGERELWVSDFKSTDSDPIGMAIIPQSYAGTDFNPGDVIVVDRGWWSGPDEIYRFSIRDPENEALLYTDEQEEGPLEDPLDITVGHRHVYLVDGANDGRIYQLSGEGALTLVPTQEVLGRPIAIAADPTTEDLFVLDDRRDRLLRVDPQSGEVREVAIGLADDRFCSLDVTPDGKQMVITVGDLILVLTATGDHRSLPPDQRHQRLVDHYTEIIQDDPKNWIASRERGALFREAKQWKQAIADYTSALECGPQDAHTFNARSICHCVLQDFEAALQDSNRAVELDPQSWVYSHRAWPLSELSRYEEAIADCNRALKLNPNYDIAMQRRGLAHQNLSNYRAAVTDYVAALKLNASSIKAWKHLPFCARRVKTPEDLAALDELHEHLESDAKSLSSRAASLAELYLIRATLHNEAGDLAQAIADCETAHRLTPQSPRPSNKQGEWHVAAGQWKEAIDAYSRALKIDQEDNVAIAWLGVSLLASGDVERYREHCLAMLDRHAATENRKLGGAVAECFLFQPWPKAELEKPLVLAQLAADESDSDAWDQLRYGALLFRAGQYGEASKQLNAALERQADKPHGSLLFYLAMTHHALSDVEQARLFFQRGEKWLAENSQRPRPIPSLLLEETKQLLSRDVERSDDHAVSTNQQ